MRFILSMTGSSGCVLCEIADSASDDSALVVHRSELSYVVLNKYPYNSGHLMVVPKQHAADLADLSDDQLLDLHCLIRDALGVLRRTYRPQGYNVGMNLGQAGGAGIRDHLHYHVVPRWNGDTNYMPVLGETKVLPETLEETYRRLAAAF